MPSPRTVMSSGSPGPPPTKCILPRFATPLNTPVPEPLPCMSPSLLPYTAAGAGGAKRRERAISPFYNVPCYSPARTVVYPLRRALELAVLDAPAPARELYPVPRPARLVLRDEPYLLARRASG